MIEDWVIFVLIGLILRGLYSYVQKYLTTLKVSYESIILLSSLFAAIVFIPFTGFNLVLVPEVILISILLSILYYIGMKITFKSLEHLSASTFFINFRIFTTIFLLIAGIILFKETVTTLQVLGILLGVIIFFLLIENKTEVKKHINIKLGISLLFIYILLMTLANIINKIISTNDAVFTIMSFQFFFMFIISLGYDFLYPKKNLKHLIKNIKQTEIIYSIILALLNGFIYFFILKAYSLGHLVIVYKIYSFEIIVPVLLSIIFLKEEVTYKKILAFILTIVSILLLI